MTVITRRTLIAGLAAWPALGAAQTVLIPYALAARGTSVGFSFALSGVAQSGTMPVQSAPIRLFPDFLGNILRVDQNYFSFMG